jgi:predicted PurR-regulated permease PerM
MLTDKPFTFDRTVRLALAAALAWGGVLLLGHLSDALIPFAAAVLLAYLLNPLVERMRRLVRFHGLAVALTLLLAAALAWLAAWLVLPVVGQELAHMAQVMRQFVTDSDLARRAAERLPPDLWQWLREFLARDDVRSALDSGGLGEMAKNAAARLLPGVWGVLSGTLDVLMAVIGSMVVLLYLVFLLADYARYRDGWPGLLPGAWRARARETVAEFELAMRQYFRGQALIAGCTGVLFAVGFSLVGLPMAVLLGLFLGALNMVPYLQILGMPLAFGLALMRALETGGGFWAAVLPVAAVFAVVQVIQDGVLTPRIMGKKLGLSPAVILLSLSIWGKLLGMLGLIIALPMTCLCLVWWRRVVAPGQEPDAAPPLETDTEPASPATRANPANHADSAGTPPGE